MSGLSLKAAYEGGGGGGGFTGGRIALRCPLETFGTISLRIYPIVMPILVLQGLYQWMPC